MTAGGVEVDASKLNRDVRKLADRITKEADSGTRRHADETASRISSRVPRRSGRLASTVGVVTAGDGGYGVTYGGGLPYAGYIEKRSGAVEAAVDDADRGFIKAMQQVADRETDRL